MFNSEPSLQNLISDNKISLLPPDVWYKSGDESTINTLKSYFQDQFEAGGEEENYMMEDQFESKKETMVKKYNDFIKEEKKFKDLGKPGPENPRCSSVRVENNDLKEYSDVFQKLVDDGLAFIDGNNIWYFRGDKNTRNIIKSDDHVPFAHDEEFESVKTNEEFKDDSFSNDSIVCPYCQSIQEEHPENIMSGGGGLGDEFAECTCDKCGEKFDCSKVVEVKYYTRKR